MLRAATRRNRGIFPKNSLRRNFSEKNSANLPSQADVVIIGGGATGCSVLYHLAKRGVKAVLLERAKIATTWHTTGLFWRLRPNDIEIQLLEGTRRMFSELEEQTGSDVGFTKNGGLFIARTEERLKEYSRMQTIGHMFGIESTMLSPSEAAKLSPILDPRAFKAALYCPGDGSIDPAIYASTLVKAAAKNGGQLIENCPVSKIQLDQSTGVRKIKGVETAHGVIKTGVIVNAAGVWARNVAQLVSLDVPIVAMKHAFIVTDSIPEAKNTPNIRDHDASIYYRVVGDTLQMGGYETNPEIVKEVPNDYQFSLYELDFSIFDVHMGKASELTPVLKNIGIKSQVCGPESFTPDHRPILGEDPRLTGLFHACGLNSSGIMTNGGIGEQMALWITKGRPDIQIYNYDIRRFTPDMRSHRAWITETSHESYLKNYAITFPHDQRLAGRNFKIDVFHELLVGEGAVMEQMHGWERPAYFLKESTAPVRGYDWYGHYDHVDNPDKRYEEQLAKELTFDFPTHHTLIGEEALAARTNVALFNQSSFAKMYLTGPDAQRAADYLFTAHTDLVPEKVTYTCMLNKNGGVEGNVTVTGLTQGLGTLVGPILKGRGYYIVAGGACGYHMICHLRREIERNNFKAVITDVTDQLGVLSIQGPQSGKLLQSLTEFPITDEKIPMGMSQLITINGHTCRAMRVSYVGELGYELHIPFASCIPIYHKLEDIGKSFDMRYAGYRAMYSLSCEKGYHLWNRDLRIDDNPVEANLTKMCRTEGTYLGKQHVDRLRQEGVRKKRVFFTLKDQIPLWGLETIWRDDAIVGYLRRGEYAYFMNCSIGTGYVQHPKGDIIDENFLKKGNYDIEVMGKKYPATLHLRSPFDPQNLRMLGQYESEFQEQGHFED